MLPVAAAHDGIRDCMPRIWRSASPLWPERPMQKINSDILELETW